MPDQENGLEKQAILFLDLLGISLATEDPDNRRQSNILELLKGLASNRQNASVEKEDENSSVVKPAFASFSDSIVVSWPPFGIGDHRLSSIIAALQSLPRLVGGIAFHALQSNLLVRGSITIGNLYNSNGVIFGNGLVEAYQLETKVAVYPRVVISSEIVDSLSNVGFDLSHLQVFRDTDGLFCLDFYSHCVIGAINDGPDKIQNVQMWWRNLTKIVRSEKKKMAEGRKTAQLSKWSWFSNQLETTFNHRHPALRDKYQLSMSELN